VKLPDLKAINIGALYAAVVAISLELHAPHWTQVLIGAVGTLLAALTVHPHESKEAVSQPPPGVPAVSSLPEAARTPDRAV
jgi:hypothetical protein